MGFHLVVRTKGNGKLIAFSGCKAFEFIDSRVGGKEGFNDSIGVSLVSRVTMRMQVLPEVF